MPDIKKGQVWENPETRLSFTVKEVRKDSVVVEVERNGRTKAGEPKLVVNEREVPNDIWWAFSKAFTDLRK